MKRVNIYKFIVTCIFIVLFVLFCFVFPTIREVNNDSLDFSIWALSVCGWVQLLFSLWTWRKISGSAISIYSIFVIISYLFTFGQCLMWAIGIHYSGEIGQARLYTLTVPTRTIIVQTQIITLMGLFAFHTGAVLFYKKKKKAYRRTIQKSTDSMERSTLYQTCKITSIISTPLMFYSIIRNIVINNAYGYGAALYNADIVASQNNIVLLLRMMYFPSIVGLLVSSQYNKTVMRICYTSFFFFMVLGLFAGDRGEWLFPLCILIWMHHKYYRKITKKAFAIYAIAGAILIIICVAVRNTRITGVSLAKVIDSIVGEKNPIISAIFELGGSMRIALIVLEHGWGIYPFGNTYVHALLGMVTEKVIKFFQPNYVSLSAWFSRVFLRISYGAGFSFVGEAIMNYGPYGSIAILFVIGILFSKIAFSAENIDFKACPLKAFFCISTSYSIIQCIRNTMLVAGKTWVFSTVIIVLLYYLVSLLSGQSRHIRKNSKG